MRLFPRTKQYPVQLRTTKFLKSATTVLFWLQSTTPESTTPVLLRTTKYYFVLQSTSPVLLRTTKYYSVLQTYYKVLVQYYFVLQSTTPVLVQYYRVLLQYYFVLQRTPVLQSTTKDYSSTTSYYKVLLQ